MSDFAEKKRRESNNFVDQKIREGVLTVEDNVISISPEVFAEWKKTLAERRRKKS